GQNNVAMGDAALKLISIADGNTAVGASAGASLTGGSNTAIGWNAMAGGQGSTGDTNTAVGGSALRGLTSGKENVALGNSALLGNTGASQNIAIGAAALWHQVYERPGQASYNTQNIAIGEMALGNTNPTAVDFFDNATNGASNVGVGHYALQDNTTGFGNVALGNNSGLVNTTGNYNIHLGDSAKASGQAVSNEIVIGHGATGLGSNSTLIGNSSTTKAYIKGISGVTSTGGVAVYVNSDGQLGTVSSSRRFKENIQDMAGASSRIFNLRPVTFNYKAAYGGGGTQFGLIAEEVDQVIPEMTVRDKDGQIETVAYQLLPPMLLNEAQKQHKAIEMLQADNSTLKAEVDTLKAQVAAILARLPR
ncbi:MAG: tail fiber domain-containing protein, partial [Acidobacteriota bacterium]